MTGVAHIAPSVVGRGFSRMVMRTAAPWRDRWRATTLRRVPLPGPADLKDPIVVGPLRSRSGIGHGARLMVRDLLRRDVSVRALDVTHLLGLAPAEIDVPRLWLGGAVPRGDLIFHLNPPNLLRIWRSLGLGPAAGRRVVGYWAWELERVPAWWTHAARCLDEIWVPSTFVADAVRTGLGGGAAMVRIVPHPVDAEAPISRGQADRVDARQRLDLPEQAFVVATSFSMASGFRRKNPLAAIAAFRRAFTAHARQAHLLIRVLDRVRDVASWRLLQRAAGNDPRIRLIDADVAACMPGDLYAAGDVYISLHRSEGYGLNIAEALRSGMPTIATGWSLAPELAADAMLRVVPSTLVPVRDPAGPYAAYRSLRWAEPDIGVAAAHLHALCRP